MDVVVVVFPAVPALALGSTKECGDEEDGDQGQEGEGECPAQSNGSKPMRESGFERVGCLEVSYRLTGVSTPGALLSRDQLLCALV